MSRYAKFPITLDRDYPCHGTDAEGKRVHFDDILFPGQRIGSIATDDNVWGPYGIVGDDFVVRAEGNTDDS